MTVSGGNPAAENFGYQESLGGIAGKVCAGSGDGLCNNPALDSPLSGVTVTLRWAGTDGFLGTDDDVTASLVTDASGAYLFNGANITAAGTCAFNGAYYAACPLAGGLPPGTYQINETNLFGYQSIADADGGNPDSISLVLASGESKTGQDFEDRLVKAAIGNLVWLDVDGDGVQDVGEPGLPNVTVRLYRDADGNAGTTGDRTLVGTQLTDVNGNYLFDGIGVGYYLVDVVDATLPSGLKTAPATTDPSGIVQITTAEQVLDVDFGYVSLDANKVIIGDRLWADANANGVQDPSEVGIAGVALDLKNLAGTVVATHDHRRFRRVSVHGRRSGHVRGRDRREQLHCRPAAGLLGDQRSAERGRQHQHGAHGDRRRHQGRRRLRPRQGRAPQHHRQAVVRPRCRRARRGRERNRGRHRQSARCERQGRRHHGLGCERQRRLQRRARWQLHHRRDRQHGRDQRSVRHDPGRFALAPGHRRRRRRERRRRGRRLGQRRPEGAGGLVRQRRRSRRDRSST